MSEAEIAKLKENLKHVNIWKFTADPDYSEEEETLELSKLPFEVKSALQDGVFDVKIQGRMDTLTAPQLLQKYEEVKESITAIHVDVSRMVYVSSAGLRVLLVMYKGLEDKSKFALTGVRDEVREILETTGFDQFFVND